HGHGDHDPDTRRAGAHGLHAGGRGDRGRQRAQKRVPGVHEQTGRAAAGRRDGRGRTGVTAMILMIDNYDSFTYNLVQYLGEMGEELVVHRNDQITVDEVAALGADRIIISPGPCTPNEAGISVAT